MLPHNTLPLILRLLRFLPRLHGQQRALQRLLGRRVFRLPDPVFQLFHLVLPVAVEEGVVLLDLALVERPAQRLESRVPVLPLGDGNRFALSGDGFLAR